MVTKLLGKFHGCCGHGNTSYNFFHIQRCSDAVERPVCPACNLHQHSEMPDPALRELRSTQGETEYSACVHTCSVVQSHVCTLPPLHRDETH